MRLEQLAKIKGICFFFPWHVIEDDKPDAGGAFWANYLSTELHQGRFGLNIPIYYKRTARHNINTIQILHKFSETSPSEVILPDSFALNETIFDVSLNPCTICIVRHAYVDGCTCSQAYIMLQAEMYNSITGHRREHNQFLCAALNRYLTTSSFHELGGGKQ